MKIVLSLSFSLGKTFCFSNLIFLRLIFPKIFSVVLARSTPNVRYCPFGGSHFILRFLHVIAMFQQMIFVRDSDQCCVPFKCSFLIDGNKVSSAVSLLTTIESCITIVHFDRTFRLISSIFSSSIFFSFLLFSSVEQKKRHSLNSTRLLE